MLYIVYIAQTEYCIMCNTVVKRHASKFQYMGLIRKIYQIPVSVLKILVYCVDYYCSYTPSL